jgi:hypothetical protein
MTRAFALLAGCLALSGCSSFTPGEWVPSLPASMPTLPFGTGGGIAVRLDSNPPGAEARTSLGPGCRTPCSVTVPVAEGFTVTFALAGFETQTIQVSALRSGGLGSEPVAVQITPDPVYAELAPAAAPASVATKKPARPKPRAAAKPAAPSAEPASTAPSSGTRTTAPPAAQQPPPSQRMIPGSQPTAPASAWPPPR